MAANVANFNDLCKLNYKAQAVWFLNGFWDKGLNTEGENLWENVKRFSSLDKDKQNGHDLDEFNSHRILEGYEQTMSVQEMREALRKIDQNKNGRMSLIEYFIYKYGKQPTETFNSPQGDNKQEIEEAQAKMAEVQAALADVMEKLAAQTVALKAQEVALKEQEVALKANNAKLSEQTKAVAEADSALAAVKVAEAEVKKAEAELQAAVDELNRIESEYKSKIAAAEAIANDESQNTVKRGKASNEAAQLKSEDPLPLRKAKITQEAALKKITKQRKIAEEKTAEADAKKKALEAVQRQLEETQKELEAKKAALEEAKRNLEEAVSQLNAALADLEAKMSEAEAQLAAAKSKGGVAYGAIWWMERELYEADKSMPQKKQKYDHSKPFQFKQ